MAALLQAVGAVLTLAALADVYLTVLFARSGTGLLSPRLHRAGWAALRATAAVAGSRGRRLLQHGGPLLIVMTLTAWAALLLVGFGLVVWPELGSAVQASGGRPTPRDFGTALYFAGYSLSTLGTGDLVPKTPHFRLLMILQAAIGFSVLTLTLSYVTSVYAALARRNRFALSLHHLTADTGDAAELLARLNGAGHDARRVLGEVAVGLDDLYESHHFYPVLHYFFFPEPHYAMARILYVALDAATLLRAGGDEALAPSAEADAVWRSGTHLLNRLSETFLPERERQRWADDHASGGGEERWRRRYRAADERLRKAQGAPRTPSVASAEERYVLFRRAWDGEVRTFCLHMAYFWDEVAVGDCGPTEDAVRPA